MDKRAGADYPIHELLAQRWSPRAFADRPVAEADLRSLLEAARWAPSCFNDQPWSFIVAVKQDAEAHRRLAECLLPGNRTWAEKAPVLMISVARLHFERNGKPNRHAVHDVGLAVANLAIQAAAMDLYVHQMAGVDFDKVRAVYGVPEGFEPVAGLALGYMGDPADLPEALAERERAPRLRKPQREFAFFGEWRS